MKETQFLASVSNVNEADSMLTAGADIIDIKDPRKGALGAVDALTARLIVNTIAGRVITSATIGDLPMEVTVISSAMNNISAVGVDIIKIGIFADSIPVDILQLCSQFASQEKKIVLVFFADRQPHIRDFATIAEAGIYGVMLDTADKTKGSLRTILDDRILDNFIRLAQANSLYTGLAGSLEQSDIQSLLKLGPDYLGFRGALCDNSQRTNAIDMQAARHIRAMIPLNDPLETAEQDLMVSVN